MSQPTPTLPQPVASSIHFPSGDFYSDEPPLESDLHRDQIDLLLRLLKWHYRDRQDIYASGNLTIYFSPNQKKSEFFRGPDIFVVLDTEAKDRKSWVVWQENGKYPNLIIELLSDSTADTDRGEKKAIYQDIFRTPDYFWFDPASLEFQGFHLMNGKYEPLTPNTEGWLWSQQLQLYLGVAQGTLRLFSPEGVLVPLPEEAANQKLIQQQKQTEQAQQKAEQAQQKAEQAQQEAEQAQQRAERFAERLRAAGIDPEEI